jgi:hypothetical protein
MFKLVFFILVIFSFNSHSIFAQNQTINNKINLVFNSINFLGTHNHSRSHNKGMVNYNVKYHLKNLSSKLTFNYDDYNKFTFDGSYLQYNKGIATIGVGSINRLWSFSDNTSLILSHNARPTKSIYLNLKNRFGYDWLPAKANWSLEVFNGITEGSYKNSKSMLIGARAILSPNERLNLELVQTSQWGGSDYSTGLSSLNAALFTDTNESANANINKMAGFGISYLIPHDNVALRIYGQMIGEDEAGNLPSCFSYLAGLEWSNTKLKYPTTLTIESVNTRIKKTTNGNCGANTMYNNGIYDYTHYGTSMGAEIDSQGTSLGIFGKSQISEKINIEYLTKVLVINEKDWPDHRLSSNRQEGSKSLLGVSWKRNAITLKSNIYFQDFILDKAKINSKYGVGISSSIIF